MIAAVLGSLAFLAVAPATSATQEPMRLAQTVRLPLTPTLDGRLTASEWDLLAGQTYYQWGNGRLYVAFRASEPSEGVLSLDLNRDGWLVGNDNYEIRVSAAGVRVRRLNARNPDGPVWEPLPGVGAISQVAASLDETVVEAEIVDPGYGFLPQRDRPFGLRLDVQPVNAMEIQAFVPRVMTVVSHGVSRGDVLPEGVGFAAFGAGGWVTPGETLRVGFAFAAPPEKSPSRIAVRGAGEALDGMARSEIPLSAPNRRNTRLAEYTSAAGASVPLGWRWLAAEPAFADGLPSLVHAAFEVRPPLDVEGVASISREQATDRLVRHSLYVRSNVSGVQRGRIRVTVAEPLRVLNRNERAFEITLRRGKSRQSFDLYVPGGTHGVFPVTYTLEAAGRRIEERGFVRVDPANR
jgi:hypothetical protein